MLRVVSCLSTQHDWRLILLAVAICFVASSATIKLFHRSLATAGHTRLLWQITTAAVSGYGIWATHFIALLAFSPGLPAGYDLPITLLSFVTAAIVTGGGFVLATTSTSSRTGVAGGVTVGLGIAAMHYAGMHALEIPGRIEWAVDLVVASIILGCTFSILAVLTAKHSQGPGVTLLAVGSFATGIVAHHFTAMGAARIIPDMTVVASTWSFSPHALTVAIASTSITLLGASLIAVFAATFREQAVRFETALANMSQGVCMFDKDKRIVVANPTYAELYGLAPESIVPGTTLREILEARVARGTYANIDTREFVEVSVASFSREVSEILHLADGRVISVLRRPMADGGVISTHEDITKRRQAEDRVAHLALHDALTNLPNRALFRERAEQALAAISDGGRAFAVLLLDLDRFKEVNDTLGHPVGDALLNAVSLRLLNCIRDDDTVSRLGGDEFAIIQRSLVPSFDCVVLAKRIVEVINQPFDLDGHHVCIGTSIGIAIAPGDGNTPDQLLKNADLALYQAKKDRNGTYHLFEPEMDRSMQERRALETDLREALTNKEFALHYQPIVNLERGEICGLEALIRWRHVKRGDVSPAEFIPLAEEIGLVVPIGDWVLKQACTDAAAWPKHLWVAVNVSPAQFKAGNFADAVIRILTETGMNPQRLELEITESVVFRDQEAAFKALNRLHEIGVRIALDDFGTGYSSLSNLRKFPFDKIKIDRCFINDLSAANIDALAFVRSIVQLGVTLGIATTAEGVETFEQSDYVKAEGCTEMQGYYICPPSSAKDIERLIRGEWGKSKEVESGGRVLPRAAQTA